MIANDPARSFEFFSRPVQAGREGRALPFEAGQIVGLHVLRAIILALVQYFFAPKITFNETTLMATTPQEEQIFEFLQKMMEVYNSSPILIAVFGFFYSFLLVTLFWQVGRALWGSEIGWREMQSSYVRFIYVKLVFLVVVSVLYGLMPSPVLLSISNIVSLYFMILSLFVLQGALDLKSVWQAVLVVLLAWMAMIGALFILSLFIILVMV